MKYCGQLYANELDYIGEIDKFPGQTQTTKIDSS